MHKLITVEDTFTIKNRGTVVTGWLEMEGFRATRPPYPVKIIRPDGTGLPAQITGSEDLFYHKGTSDNDRRNVAYLLKDIEKKDVPSGSEIFLIED